MNKDEKLKDIGKKIRDARLSKGFSQEKLAQLSGKDQPNIHRVENGRVNPSYIFLDDICRGLNITIKQLFTDY